MPSKTARDQLASAIRETLISPNIPDSNLEPANVVDVIANGANGLFSIAESLQRLGNADASTPMGGLEALGASIKNAGTKLAGSLDNIADAIREAK